MRYLFFVCLCGFVLIQNNLGQINPSINACNLVSKADSMLNDFQYDNSFVYYYNAAILYEQKQDWLHSAKIYRLASNPLLKAGKYDSAAYFAKKALSIAEQFFRNENKDEMLEQSDIYLGLANIERIIGKYRHALNLCSKALKIVENTDSTDRLRITGIWSKQGLIYYGLGMQDSALYITQKACKVRVNFLGENNPDIAQNYNTIGAIFVDKGAYNLALENYQKSLKIRLSVLGENHPDVAQSYNNIGAICSEKGAYDQAMEYYQKSLNIWIMILGEMHANLAISYGNIGRLYKKKGIYDLALEYYQKSLKIAVLTLGEMHPNVAFGYNNIGAVYSEMGAYDQALEYYHKALKIWTSTLGETHPNITLCYNNMGIIYLEKKDYDLALDYHQKVLKMRLSSYGEEHPDVATSYLNNGSVYWEKGDYDQALVCFQKSLKIHNSFYGEMNPVVAKSYNGIGETYCKEGHYDQALTYLQKALKIRNSVLGEIHPDVANSYNNIGNIYMQQGDYNQALFYYQKALMANIPEFHDSSTTINPTLSNVLSKPVLLQTLTNKANTLYQLFNKTNSDSDIELSISTYELAFHLINDMRNEYNSEATKLLISDKTKNYYAQAAKVALIYAKINPQRVNYTKTFEFIENGKSATLSAQLNEAQAKHFAGIPDTLLDKEKELKINMNFYTTEINKNKYNKNGYDTTLLSLNEDLYFKNSRQYDSLILYFETTFPEYYALKFSNKTASIEEIQSKLDSKSALINYFADDSGIYAATITDVDYHIMYVPVDSTFKRSVINYYKSIKESNVMQFYNLNPVLYKKLIEPIKDQIALKENLIIVPDDYLLYLPFETLAENASYKEEFCNLNYLVKNYSITYNYSASLWLNSRKTSETYTQNNKYDFVGFAPVFSDEAGNGYIVKSNKQLFDSTENNLANRALSDDGKNFRPLPYSEKELLTIIKNFHKRNEQATGYFKEEATKEAFIQNIKNATYIHIATHGFTNDKTPGLSGLAFSQSQYINNRKDSLSDNIMYAGEIYNLKLNADLVVLSACETGIGKMIRGEGMLSLTRGFLYGGASNIIYSLWSVLDKSTEEFMIEFYNHILNGEDYTMALRETRLSMIKNPDTSFPRHWAGFIILGE